MSNSIFSSGKNIFLCFGTLQWIAVTVSVVVYQQRFWQLMTFYFHGWIIMMMQLKISLDNNFYGQISVHYDQWRRGEIAGSARVDNQAYFSREILMLAEISFSKVFFLFIYNILPCLFHVPNYTWETWESGSLLQNKQDHAPKLYNLS